MLGPNHSPYACVCPDGAWFLRSTEHPSRELCARVQMLRVLIQALESRGSVYTMPHVSMLPPPSPPPAPPYIHRYAHVVGRTLACKGLPEGARHA